MMNRMLRTLPTMHLPRCAPSTHSAVQCPGCYTWCATSRQAAFPMLSILPSLLAIIVCGGIGATVAWFAVDAMEWTGVTAAIGTAILAMFIAFALFAGGMWLAKT